MFWLYLPAVILRIIPGAESLQSLAKVKQRLQIAQDVQAPAMYALLHYSQCPAAAIVEQGNLPAFILARPASANSSTKGFMNKQRPVSEMAIMVVASLTTKQHQDTGISKMQQRDCCQTQIAQHMQADEVKTCHCILMQIIDACQKAR